MTVFSTDMKKSNIIAVGTLTAAVAALAVYSVTMCEVTLKDYIHLPKWGISAVGIVFLLMLFIPNIIWSKNQPKGYEESAKLENKLLLTLERMGEGLVSTLVLIDRRTDRFSFSPRTGYLAIALILMILYELYWIKYFRSSRTLADMYSDYCGFPLAGASLPVFAVFLLGVYACNIFLIAAAFILGIGHIGIHIMHKKEIEK